LLRRLSCPGCVVIKVPPVHSFTERTPNNVVDLTNLNCSRKEIITSLGAYSHVLYLFGGRINPKLPTAIQSIRALQNKLIFPLTTHVDANLRWDAHSIQSIKKPTQKGSPISGCGPKRTHRKDAASSTATTAPFPGMTPVRSRKSFHCFL